MFAAAAILKNPEQFRSFVIESGAGLTNGRTVNKLVGGVALDVVSGAMHTFIIPEKQLVLTELWLRPW